jgi:YfiH family protein
MKNIRNNIIFHFGNAQESLETLQQRFALQSLIILDQVHGIEGYVITKENSCMSFKSQQGDFLVTNERYIGIGVLTADCLPIIFIDKKHDAIGIAHAGWRGSIQNISKNILECMHRNYNTCIEDISIYFGPCAKACCYEVQKGFLEPFTLFSFGLDSFSYKKNHLFFDLTYFNKQLLLSMGLPQTAFNDEYNCCTICNEDYFSYRRQGDTAGRQVSIVAIL